MTTNLEKEETKSESCDNHVTPTISNWRKESKKVKFHFPFPTLRTSVDQIDIPSITSLGNLINNNIKNNFITMYVENDHDIVQLGIFS
jgi:hypothetical protein